jgi:UPF0716 protein FxsA
MLSRLLFLLILVPLADLLGLLWIAQQTSAMFAFLLVISSGVAGVAILRWQGFRTGLAAREQMRSGQMPAAALFDGLLMTVAGLLLIVPGVMTDVCGLVLLLPPVRRWLRSFIGRRFQMHVFGPGGMPARDTIIDSHVIDSQAEPLPHNTEEKAG